MKLNEKFLPVLDTALLDEIFAHVFSDDVSGIANRQKRDFIRMLKQMQGYNYAHRPQVLSEMLPLMQESLNPIEGNSEGPSFYFALGLAIKELYGMRKETFRAVMRQVTKSKLK